MSIQDVRKLGREYCQTDGSAHYVKIRENNGIDAIEIAMANGIFEDFAITNMVKYALRFKHTRNLNDLKKVSDYAHILSGVELEKQCAEVIKISNIKSEKTCESCANTVTVDGEKICHSADEKTRFCKDNDLCFWEQDKSKKASEPDNKGLLRGCFACGNKDSRFSDGCNLSYRKATECRGENLKHYVSEDALLDISGPEVTD